MHFYLFTLQKKSELQTYHIISVWDHKTKAAHGSARLVVPDRMYKLIQHYVQYLRPTPETGSEEYVFLNSHGKHLTHTANDLKLLASEFGEEELDLTPTEIRKQVSTSAASHCTDADLRRVAKHMGHDLPLPGEITSICRYVSGCIGIVGDMLATDS